MIITIKIKNIALIDAAEINFKKGLNILSGETGAGKSIIIDSISLILGSRANADLIRSGVDEASVEGLFQIEHLPWMKERLLQLDIPCEDDTFIVRRLINRSGKHRIYVNGTLVNLSTLQSLCVGLVDLCGQHEHQSLTRSHTQLELLDQYGGLQSEKQKFTEFFEKLHQLFKEKNDLLSLDTESSRKKEFLKFQIEELDKLQLKENEENELQEKKHFLQSNDQRVKGLALIRDQLDDEDSGILHQIKSLFNRTRHLTSFDPALGEIEKHFETALQECEDASKKIHQILLKSEVDPEELDALLNRLSKIAELKRKFKLSAHELLDLTQKLKNELFEIENKDHKLEQIDKEFDKTLKLALEQGELLSKKRKKISKTLSLSITAELKDLKMQDAEVFTEIVSTNDWKQFNAHGLDSVQFLIRTNSGEEAKPLGKIASGGELSRMMLSIRRVISEEGGIGVYLFDEIDSGIGGQTAFTVGKKLHSVASSNQVICITHLPQVAAFADHHMMVKKEKSGQRTNTTILELNESERKKEIARMLGGEKVTEKTLESASELITMAMS